MSSSFRDAATAAFCLFSFFTPCCCSKKTLCIYRRSFILSSSPSSKRRLWAKYTHTAKRGPCIHYYCTLHFFSGCFVNGCVDSICPNKQRVSPCFERGGEAGKKKIDNMALTRRRKCKSAHRSPGSAESRHIIVVPLLG